FLIPAMTQKNRFGVLKSAFIIGSSTKYQKALRECPLSRRFWTLCRILPAFGATLSNPTVLKRPVTGYTLSGLSFVMMLASATQRHTLPTNAQKRNLVAAMKRTYRSPLAIS